MPTLFNFIKSGIAQTDITKAFGHRTATKCRITSSFPITNSALSSCYSILPGTVLMQQQSGVGNEGKVNLILKPDPDERLLLPIKYVIYRGLDIDLLLTSRILNDTTTTVLTTGLELLDKMQLIQSGRTTDAIPVTALFGHDLTPAPLTKLDTFFFRESPVASQLFHIDGGIELGKYVVGEGGIEIMLENPEYDLTVEMAKVPFHEIDASSGGAAEVKWKKDLIRHFVDPAAFYGLHYAIEGGMEYVDTSGVRQPAADKLSIFTNLIGIFATNDKVYLDIRNENGYSYNYYNNYIGTSGPDLAKELKTGDTAAGTIAVEYYMTDGWPIHTVTVTASTTDEDNTFYIRLRVNDNQKPLLAGNKKMLPQASAPNVDQTIQFISEAVLVPGGTTPEFTEAVTVNVPNKLVSGAGASIATIVRLDYIKQIRIEDGTDAFPQFSGWDHLFGPIDTSIPWDSQDGTQWIGTHHYKYFDGLSQGYAIGARNLAITGIDPALHTITLGAVVQEQINQRVRIANSTVTTNVGDYTIIRLQTIGSTTVITVRETIPGTMQTGDTLHFETEVFVYIDKLTNTMIAKNQNITTIPAYQTGAKVKLYGVYPAGSNVSLTLTSSTLVSGNSRLVYDPSTFEEVGFGAIMETGIVSETDVASGGTGDQDSAILYAVPRYYFQNKGVQTSVFFNYRGGTAAKDRFVDMIKKTSRNFDVVKTSLHPTVGTTLILMSYSDTTTVKENIQMLGLKKSEFNSLKAAANTQLSAFHTKMSKLIPQGGRKRDADYEAYYEYKLVISGLNAAGVYAETTNFVTVYTRDGLIFSSEAFAKVDLIPNATYDDLLDKLLDINHKNKVKMVNQFTSVDGGGNLIEDKEQMQIDNWKQGSAARGNLYGLYLLDGSTGSHPSVILTGPLNTLPIDLRNELNALAVTNPTHTIADIEAIIQQKGSDLLTFARQRIRQPGQPYTNKDGILYITRLVARMVIRNHPVVIKSGKNFLDYERLFENHSRGFAGAAKADFSSYPASYKRILITGFDPFDTGDATNFNGGLDSAGHLTNAAGNIALALDGVVLGTGTDKAIIRSAIFSTRWGDFDKRWIEDFMEPYFLLPVGDLNRPNMIITFSYGLHYSTQGTPAYADHDHNWHLDRFAANYRSGGADNLFSGAQSPFPGKPVQPLTFADIAKTYIESKLPYEKLNDGTGKVDLPNNEIVINHGPFSERGINEGTRAMKGETGTFEFKVFGMSNNGNTLTDLTNQYDLSHLTDVSHFNILENRAEDHYRYPGNSFIKRAFIPSLTVTSFAKPILLKQETQQIALNSSDVVVGSGPAEMRIKLILDDPQLKFRDPLQPSFYVKIPHWDNYKDAALEGSGLTDMTAYHDIYIEARSGSGGAYMSNEIHYRTSYLREITLSTIPNGHVHVGFHKKDPGGGTPAVRIGMIADAEAMIKKFNDIP